jgi:hypothetical protein
MFPIFPSLWHFTTWLDLLDHWQSLAAGLVAVFAASVAVGGAELFSRLKETSRKKGDPPVAGGGSPRVPRPVHWQAPNNPSTFPAGSVRAQPEDSGRSPIANSLPGLGGQDRAARSANSRRPDRILCEPRIVELDGAVHSSHRSGAGIRTDSMEELVALFERACSSALPLLPYKEADVALRATIESFGH